MDGTILAEPAIGLRPQLSMQGGEECIRAVFRQLGGGSTIRDVDDELGIQLGALGVITLP